MSDPYRLFAMQPVHVRGKGEVAPKGHVSDAQRDLMEAAQRGQGAGITTDNFSVVSDTPNITLDPWSKEAWGDLR
jgi:hypothetical protein